MKEIGNAESKMELPPAFLAALEQLPRRYSEGTYNGRSYGTTVTETVKGQEIKLFAEELGGTDIVSFNLYLLSDGSRRLRPCEMAAEKVVEFVIGFEPFP